MSTPTFKKKKEQIEEPETEMETNDEEFENENSDDEETDEESVDEDDDSLLFNNLPYIIELEHPLSVGKKKITEISVVRRLKAKNLANIQVNKLTFNVMISLGSVITDEPVGIIGELDTHDFRKLMRAVNYFLASFQ